jgi:hypothetical protein
MEGSVFGSKILPAILIMVPATVSMSVQASLSAPAAEECKTSPGTNAPRGAHWYYHINRAKQHCWYLGVIDAHVHAQAVTPPASATATSPQNSNAAEAASQAAAPAAPAATAPAPMVAAQSMPAAAAPALPAPRGAGFVTRWPENVLNAGDLEQQEPSAISDSDAQRPEATGQATQMPSQSPLAEADHALASSAGEAVLRYFSIAGAIAIPLLLAAGWAAKFARRPRRPQVRDAQVYDARVRDAQVRDAQVRDAQVRDAQVRDAQVRDAQVRDAQVRDVQVRDAQVRDDWRTVGTRLAPRRHLVGDELVGLAPLVVDRHGDADEHAPTLTDPACDLKTSLAELMRDLRRAGAFEPVEETAEQPAELTSGESHDPVLETAEQPAVELVPPADEPTEQGAQQTSDEDTGDQDYYPVLEAAE